MTDRPKWCPHQDCQPVCSLKGGHETHVVCGGKLPRPEPHGEVFNTHRFCLADNDTCKPMLDMHLNRGDWFVIGRVMGEMFPVADLVDRDQSR